MVKLKKVAACIITAAVMLVFAGCGFRLVTVDGISMLPTLQDGSMFIMTTSTGELRHNDIIVIDIPIGSHDSSIIVTRITGLPGDEISIDFESGFITRNGEVLPREIINGQLYENGHRIMAPTHFAGDMAEGAFTVPENHLFVMGDNRNNSLDSRSDRIGFVDIENVMGRAIRV